MTTEFDPAEVAQQAFAPGWEREHDSDYGEYLDSLNDPDDPSHDIAVAGEKKERSKQVPAAADRILVFTGPGVSTESGIPDSGDRSDCGPGVDPAEFSRS